MRRLLITLILLALVLGTIWAGAETLLARELRRTLAGGAATTDIAMPDPMAGSVPPGFLVTDMTAARATPLRNPARFGVNLLDLRIDSTHGTLTLPRVGAFAPLRRPNELRLELPGNGIIETAGQTLPLGLQAPRVVARLDPLGGLVVSRMEIDAAGLTLDGRKLSGPLDLDARVAPSGADSPAQGGMAYDVTAHLSGVDLSALPALGGVDLPIEGLPTGPLSLQEKARFWLDGTTAPRALASGVYPAITGLRTGEVALSMGEGLQATVIADLHADAQGRAGGQVMVYSRDASRLLDHVVQLGYLTDGQRRLAMGMLRLISDSIGDATPVDAGREALMTADPAQAQELLARQTMFRPAQNGELRLPLKFEDGVMYLGTIALGPAPLIGAAPPR
ncbi:DUF2125 domain-containing protein [Paracoccus sp. DMF-8]|uniref:DUF2125 domain-containing protein n=1 Tax=Paracoccus sp. DMF-8 TaxID=3019445 RepID=UPI0023E789FE|nr:DUF2125 domain-containing protein [Paracoccus sp. DMF-8]MDF3606049.1 DUF2125 domain-containing protein [Paracoccus sp. DMF-8]